MSWKYPPLPVTATFTAKRKRNWGRPNSRLRSCRWPPGRCETQSQLPPRCGIGPGRPSWPCPRFPLPHPAFTALPSSSHCRVSAQAILGFCPGVCAASGAPPSSLRVFPSRPPLERSPTPNPASVSDLCFLSEHSTVCTCFPQSAFFLSLPHSLCESHRDRAVLLCPGAQHRAWHRAQVLSLRKTKPSWRWRLQHAGTPSSLLDFVLRQCSCSLVSDSPRG